MVEHPTYSIDINFGQVNQVRSFGSYSFVKNNIFSMPPLLYLCTKTVFGLFIQSQLLVEKFEKTEVKS